MSPDRREPDRAGEVSQSLLLWLVPSPRAATLLAHLIVVGTVLAALLLVVVPWQQTAGGMGRVIAYAPLERQQLIEAPIEGRVVAWSVREGSHVEAGQPVAEISDNDAQLLERLRQERAALVDRLDAAEERARSFEERATALGMSRQNAIAAADNRARMAADRVRAAEQAVAAAVAAAKTSQLNLERQEALAQQGLTSTRSRELAELEAVRAQTEEDRARVALNAARSEQQALLADRLRAGSDATASQQDARASRAAALAEAGNARAELARLDVRLARQSSQSVRAPRTGTILRLVAGVGGEMVRAGDALAVLIPDSDDRAVELWVSGNDVPLVSEGRAVRVQFEGWPALQFSGWPQVAVGAFGGRVALVDATDDGKGRFRIVVVPDGSEPWPANRYLRQGVRARGLVLLERVRLGYELWRQLNGFSPSLPEEGGGKSEAKPAKAEGGK